jgi:hypothetical protein
VKYMRIDVLVLLLTALAIGCGNGNSHSNPNNQTSLQGQWEASMPGTLGSQTEYFEASLLQSGQSLSATNTFTFFLASDGSYSYCTPPSATFSGSADGNQISGTVNTCYGTATFSGTVSNNNSIAGTYKSSAGCGPSGNQCVSGAFTAQRISPPNGSYAGTLRFKDGTSESVSVVASTDSTGTVSVTGTVSGADAGLITLSGPAIGASALVSGTVSGQPSSLYVWQHSNNVYVVDSDTGLLLGTLTKQ